MIETHHLFLLLCGCSIIEFSSENNNFRRMIPRDMDDVGCAKGVDAFSLLSSNPFALGGDGLEERERVNRFGGGRMWKKLEFTRETEGFDLGENGREGFSIFWDFF